ncbi:MAG TPA: 2-oxoglutarate dehydrogenase complex dihydrolipoyllysine-residue succinyltransferase [Cytophagaceae bacterium]|jgi:2-oxoglutarate dehydrogenase E2 component (dihydrolipoamide succinyltransferase)|nr:2-oxoglutarate dehydrogenase complex dihydrolipoyllysine-residue succinyltransferase [Cytophagaceae bacterium]
MALEIKIPAVGESITEVTIGKWVKKDGDVVKADELLLEIESDKATFELNSEGAGVLRIKAKEGDVVQVGAVIASIEDGGASSKPVVKAESTAPSVTKAAAPSPGTGEVKEIKVPAVGESISEVTIGTWAKKTGDTVQVEDLLCEIESDKATFELRAEVAGVLETVAKQGDVLPIGGLVCKIKVGASSGTAPVVTTAAPQAATASSGGSDYAKGHAAPAAAKILDEKGISPADVQGTGKDGRITKEDAQNAQNKPVEKTAASNGSAAPKAPAGSRVDDRQKMTSLRKTVSRRLVAVKNETAMLTTFNEVDMKPIMDLRAKYKDSFKERNGVNLGFMSFFTKAVCQALLEYPAVNAYIDGDEIVYHNYCDVSIAVSAPKGLVVPVIRNAETMSFDQIEKEIVRLAGKARDNKLTIEEMTGGTFTITNGGIFGSMLSTPIINAPQSAILGMHNIVERPIAMNGQVVIRPIMYLALSYDHRIIDGRESVGFLVRVKQLLEDPTRLLLGV